MADPRLQCPECDGTEFVVDLSEYQTLTLDLTDGREEWNLEEVDGIVHLYSAKCEKCETRVDSEFAKTFALELAHEVSQ